MSRTVIILPKVTKADWEEVYQHCISAQLITLGEHGFVWSMTCKCSNCNKKRIQIAKINKKILDRQFKSK